MALSTNCLQLLLVLSCCATFQTYKHFNRNNGSPGHLLVAPSSFLYGTNNKICISRFGPASLGTATAQVELLSSSSNPIEKVGRHLHKFIARARKTFPDGNGGCIEMFVPKTSHRKAVLHLRMRFDALPNYKISSRKDVKIQHNTNINIIQTDKPIYRAGEIVKFRVLQLKTDLIPQNSPIYRVYVEAPSDIFGGPVKIAQWFNVSVQMGHIQREYKLDTYARKGDWRIVVDSRDPSVASTVRTFHVTDYKLPKFHVSVDYEKNVVHTFRQLLWTICARYMYDTVAEGTIYINVRSDTYNSQKVNFSTVLSGSSGCYNYTLRTKLLGFGEDQLTKPSVVIADIAFQEAGSKIWKNTTAISHIQDEVVDIKYVNGHKNYFRPGLPHKVEVKVTDWNGNDVSEAKIQFCKNFNEEIDNNLLQNKSRRNLLKNCVTGITDSVGSASFVFTVPNGVNLEYVSLNSIVIDHPLRDFEIRTKKQNFSSTTIKLYSWGNKTKVNMDIGSPISDSDFRLGDKYIFPIFLKFDNDNVMKQITLHYLVVIRSGTIFSWGTSTQCIHAIKDVQNIETIFGPSISNDDCFEENYSETGVYKMMLNVKLSYQMCPYSYLIVYFLRPNGELIVANKLFNTKECFPNKLTQQWIPNTVSPSAEAKLHLNSVGPALCMFGAKNIAFNHIVPRSSVHDDLIERLDSFINRTNAESMNNICFSEYSPIKYDETTRTFFWNTMKTFLMTGLEIITDVLPATAKCPNSDQENDSEKPEELFFPMYTKFSKERVYFPETWLWDVRLMDASGVLDISTTVPDDITNWESEVFCVTRSGIAATVPNENAILRVFQPFFVEISAPSVIKRGEHVQMFYKIHNYMDHTIPVVFDIEVSPTAAATITSHEGAINRVSCISSKQSLITHFTVKAHQLRSINITVIAQIKSNMQQLCLLTNPASISHDVRDTVVKEIFVEPEGIPLENHRSALLCINESSNKTELAWTFDRKDCVAQSENWYISLVGDITGPMNMNVDKLVSTPMGCGEQNMVLLAYNLIALEYSMAQKRTSGEVKDIAINNLLTGYQRQLGFRHSDTGAFSAFGRSDESGSTWLTAFCVKYLSILQHKWNIGAGSEVTEMASKWLLERQMENGCFNNEGQVFHREMKGGLESETSSIALAAYVIISILDAKIQNIKPSVVTNAAYCLAALKYDDLLSEAPKNSDNTKYSKTMYTYVIATLAQLKIEKYYNSFDRENKTSTDHLKRDATEIRFLTGGASNAVSLLKSIASRNGDFLWWEAGSLSVSIETTGYAILSLLTIGGDDNIMYAVAAAKWLSMHRNSNGGFISTQDTLIAIEALCSLRYAMPDIPPSMNVIVEGPGRARHFTVNPSERHKLHIVVMKSMDNFNISPSKLKIKAQGKGCLLVQATQRYNQYSNTAQRNSSFGLYIKTITDGTFNCKGNETWCMCAAILEVCISWSDSTGMNFPEMAILEIQMPTGYSPDRSLLYQLIKSENILLRRIEESKNEDTIYFYLSAPMQNQSLRPSQCFNLYLMGPKSNTMPALIKIYDYYHTGIMKSTTYTIPEECPFERYRRPHDEPEVSENPTNMNVIHLANQNWHIIDSESDLSVPSTLEGVQPVYVLPPSNFHHNDTDEEEKANQNQEQTFTNWTVIDSEMDLEFPTGIEGNEEVWEII